MWYIYVIELLPSDKKGSNSEHASTWTNYEDIRLSEISQSQKTHTAMILLMWGTSSSQTHTDRKLNENCHGLDGVIFNKYSTLILQDE